MATLVNMRMAKADIEEILDEVIATSEQFRGSLIEDRHFSANYAVNDGGEEHHFWTATCWFHPDGHDHVLLAIIVDDEFGAVLIIDRLGTQPWNSENWNFRW